MKFDFPLIFDTEPTAESLLQYGVTADKARGKYLAIGLKVAKNSYLRIRLAEAQNWKCCWCGCDVVPETNRKNTATIEHVVPKSFDGTDEWENLASACSDCNSKRGNDSPEYFMKRLQDIIDERTMSKLEVTSRRVMKRAAKMEQRGWTSTSSDGTVMNIDPAQWLTSFKVTDECKEEFYRKYVK